MARFINLASPPSGDLKLSSSAQVRPDQMTAPGQVELKTGFKSAVPRGVVLTGAAAVAARGEDIRRMKFMMAPVVPTDATGATGATGAPPTQVDDSSTH